MKDTFKAYLAQQKADNKYMTAPSKELLGEGIFANKKYNCYAAMLDFGSEYMTKALANVLINDYKKSAGTDPIKHIINLSSDDFNTKLKEKLVEILSEISKSSKNLKTLFGLGKESSALAYIQTESNDDAESTVLKYIFFKASGNQPKAYAERFKDEIGRNSKISILKNCVDIVSETYYKEDIQKKRKDSDFLKFFKPEDYKDELINDNFTITIINKLQDKVKSYLTDIDEKNQRGNLISVYSIPFKIDDKLINEVAQNNNNISDFYKSLTEKINNELINALKQVSKLEDYIGFIPTKTYGMNLYFKDKDTAIDLAEKLNQDGEGKVNERKRYEKKISKLYQLLDPNPELNSLSHPETNGDDFFRGTLFARTHVAELIKEKFPTAEDQLVIYQYVIKYDNDELKNFLHNFKLDVESDEIRSNVKQKLQLVLDNLQKIYSDELISISSEGSNLIFFFRKDAKIDAVRARIATAMSCEIAKIKVIKTAMTKKEVDTFKSKISDLEDLESFYKAVEKLNGETVKLIKGDITLKEEIIKELVNDAYQDQVLDLLLGITKSAEKSDGFAGIIITGKDKGIIEVYFKDTESYTAGKKFILQEYDKYIEKFNDNGDSVELTRADAKKLNNIIQPDNIKEYFEKILKKKRDEESKTAEENAKHLTSKLIIPIDAQKFYKLDVSDILSADKLLQISLAENFKSNFRRNLLESINMINEKSKIISATEIINRLQTWWENKGKHGTIEEYINEAEDSIKAKEISLVTGLFDEAWEHFAILLKNKITEKAGRDQSDKEFSYRLSEDSLRMAASERVGNYLTKFIKMYKMPNILSKTIKGSGNIELEFKKPEKIQ